MTGARNIKRSNPMHASPQITPLCFLQLRARLYCRSEALRYILPLTAVASLRSPSGPRISAALVCWQHPPQRFLIVTHGTVSKVQFSPREDPATERQTCPGVEAKISQNQHKKVRTNGGVDKTNDFAREVAGMSFGRLCTCRALDNPVHQRCK